MTDRGSGSVDRTGNSFIQPQMEHGLKPKPKATLRFIQNKSLRLKLACFRLNGVLKRFGLLINNL